MTIDEIFEQIEEDCRRDLRFVKWVTIIEVAICTILAVVTQ